MPSHQLLSSEAQAVLKLYPRDRIRVTLWTYRKQPLLGCWIGTEWHATPLGQAVQECWRELPREYPSWRFELFAMQPNRVDALIQLSRSQSAVGGWGDENLRPIWESVRPMVAVFKARVAMLTCGGCGGSTGAPPLRLWQLGYELWRIEDEVSWRLALRELSCRLLGLIRD